MIQQVNNICLGDSIGTSYHVDSSSLYYQHLAEQLRVKRRYRQSGLLRKRTLQLRQRLGNNPKTPPKPLNVDIDSEDLTLNVITEQKRYIQEIQSGAVEIIGRLDFESAGSIKVNRDGRWFVTGIPTSDVFYEIDTISLRKLSTIEIIASRDFNPGDYLIGTVHKRIFQGRGANIQLELDPLTLTEKVHTLHPSILVGFREARYSRNGYERRSPRRILLRQAEDVYAAMFDIANGDTDASDYMTTKATMKWVTILSSIQRKRDLYGEGYALDKALDYIFEDMSVPVAFNGCTKKVYSIYRNPVSEVIPSQVKYKGRYSPPRYCGGRMLIFDNLRGKVSLPTPMLNAISTLSNSRSSYIRI